MYIRGPRGPYHTPKHPVIQPSDGSYRLVPLTKGQNAIVDIDDFEWLSKWNWHAQWNSRTRSFYAQRRDGTTALKMERAILGLGKGDQVEVDHRSHDTLDNRRTNLRKATKSQNQANRAPQISNHSGYKGVSHFPGGKWKAQIKAHDKKIHLGLFSTKEEAARAYDKAARKTFGEFAYLNFPNHAEIPPSEPEVSPKVGGVPN